MSAIALSVPGEAHIFQYPEGPRGVDEVQLRGMSDQHRACEDERIAADWAALLTPSGHEQHAVICPQDVVVSRASGRRPSCHQIGIGCLQPRCIGTAASKPCVSLTLALGTQQTGVRVASSFSSNVNSDVESPLAYRPNMRCEWRA